MAASFSTEARIARLPGGDIAYMEAGRGPAFVLLHGIGSAARSWGAQIASLSAHWRVIAWNAPGYPPSSPLESEAPSAADYAARLEALLDSCAVSQCHLVGHSLGCLVAAHFTRLHPARVRSLTLASCALGHARLPADERARLLDSRIGDVRDLGPRGMAEKRGPRLLGPGASPDTRAAVIETMAGVDPHGYAQASRMLSGGDLIGDIEAMAPEVPIQFIFGSADVITPPEVNLRAASARPGSPVTRIEGAGHACYVEQPDAFSAALESFAREHA
ncbi:MAG: alpha/beta hydrolase [Beijerinckiaceae bacterium]|nr:alpha/beta hydrolase [Beijerinckiaceae bacterium]